MVYKTLHWYIFRELLRIFLLTSSALTTLLAFGGTFKPVTKQGIEITQLMTIISNLMPAMLAYAIPIAALFAAVLVYWRLATDNEMTACRASGISFTAIVMPALALGLLVASVDLVFVNYVVPVFLQRTERAIISDFGSLATNQINQQGQFKLDRLVIYGDSAELLPTNVPNTSEVVVHGMAGLKLKDGKPDAIVVAQQANATITDDPETGGAAIKFTLTGAAAFNPATMAKISGSVPALTEGGKPFVVASQLKSKPKFLNVSQLFNYDRNPMLFQPVRDIVDQLETLHEYQVVADRLYGAWKITGGAPMTLEMTGPGGSTAEFVKITAPRAELNSEKQLVFMGASGKQVHVERYQGRTLAISYNCDAVDVELSEDDFSGAGITGTLLLRDHVTRTDHLRRIGPDPSDVVTLSGLVLPAGIATVAPSDPQELVKSAAKGDVKSMQKLSADVRSAASRLFQEIDSELHSRGSFSLSCLTLVMLGAALGLLMRGKNPLAVFVIGFVPAILLVLLITAGRQMAEGSARNEHVGIALIWAGNVLLLGIVAVVYSKLLRQ
ncbi:MAG TPA: LptF/LptG family permease [Phycisphaerae bacterium]|nr:LptF/LptG family permease [Phycisphaerae bacterium]